MAANGPFDLTKSPIHLNDAAGARPAVPIEGFGYDGPSFGAYVEAHCPEGDPGRLMMIETTPADWPAWEKHTDADEIVYVLSGRGEFIQDIDGEHVRIPVTAGQAIINPKDVWHTADVTESITAIYLTPCPGTEHKPRD